MAERILDGIKVVELATYIAGPASAAVMADFGADVIKIEPPGRPDPFRGSNTRGADAPRSPYPYAYLVDNRNKKGIALDIKNEAGREVFRRLIEAADVFVTNMPIPTRERLAIGYEDIRAMNERIVYATITAYGETGPEAGRTGFDSTALWARTGLMDLVKAGPDYPPARSLPGMGDHPTAISLYAAIMTGLFRRERTGKGSHVSTSLAANGVWLNGMLTQAVLCGATVRCRPPREQAANALHNLYRTRDGRWIHIVFNTQQHRFAEFAGLIGRPALGTDPRFATPEARLQNVAALIPLLDAAFAERDHGEWTALLDDNGFTYGDVRRIDDLPGDRQMVEGRVFRPIDDPAAGARYVVDSPFWVDGEGCDKVPAAMPPEFGEHTDDVLRAAGYDDAGLAALRAAGAIP